MIASSHQPLHSLLALAIITPIELAVFVRILLRPHRDPSSRIAWIVVVGVLPLVGILAYLPNSLIYIRNLMLIRKRKFAFTAAAPSQHPREVD